MIDRLRKRVDHNIKMAVHLIASNDRTVVTGDLEQVTIKDGVKAVVKFSAQAENLHQLYGAAGKAVLLVVASAAEHTGGMDDVKCEADRRARDLGQEYDPKGDGKGMDKPWDGDDTVIDGNAIALPDSPLNAELDEAYKAGRQAAEDGKPKSDCPIGRHEIVSAWTQGWTDWHAENPGRQPDADVTDVEPHTEVDDDQPHDPQPSDEPEGFPA